MIDGSRWCSCGMALKRWVISRAPFCTAVVAIDVLATLYVIPAHEIKSECSG
jgi:hypothetical protein